MEATLKLVKNDNHCLWDDVDCYEEEITVTSTNLGNNNLQNAIPTKIFLLQNFEQLWLRPNDISIKFKGIEQS